MWQNSKLILTSDVREIKLYLRDVPSSDRLTMIEKLPFCHHLVSFSIETIFAEETALLAQVLPLCTKLTTLRLGYPDAPDAQMAQVFKVLPECAALCEFTTCSDCNQFPAGMIGLAENLPHCRLLRRLKVHTQMSNKFIDALVHALPRWSGTELVLSYGLDDGMMQALADVLPASRIESLHILNSAIGSIGCEALARSLCTNNVKDLRIACPCPLSDVFTALPFSNVVSFNQFDNSYRIFALQKYFSPIKRSVRILPSIGMLVAENAVRPTHRERFFSLFAALNYSLQLMVTELWHDTGYYRHELSDVEKELVPRCPVTMSDVFRCRLYVLRRVLNLE